MSIELNHEGDGVADAELPPHHDHCFVCGPRNPAAMDVRFRRIGRQPRIKGSLCLGERHQGVPGVAHGGAISALMDEAISTVLLGLGLRFVTARLDVQYLAPALIGQSLTVEAWLEHSEGRKYTVLAELRSEQAVVASATALSITVPTEHFARLGLPDGSHEVFSVPETPGSRP